MTSSDSQPSSAGVVVYDSTKEELASSPASFAGQTRSPDGHRSGIRAGAVYRWGRSGGREGGRERGEFHDRHIMGRTPRILASGTLLLLALVPRETRCEGGIVIVTAFYGTAEVLRDITWPNKQAYAKQHGYALVDAYRDDPEVRNNVFLIGRWFLGSNWLPSGSPRCAYCNMCPHTLPLTGSRHGHIVASHAPEP